MAVGRADCDADHQQALNGAPVEVCEDAGAQDILTQSPLEIELLVSFLDNGVGML